MSNNYREDRLRYENFISRLFPEIIFRNRIVSTIIYNVMRGVSALKTKVDKRTNRDV